VRGGGRGGRGGAGGRPPFPTSLLLRITQIRSIYTFGR